MLKILAAIIIMVSFIITWSKKNKQEQLFYSLRNKVLKGRHKP